MLGDHDFIQSKTEYMVDCVRYHFQNVQTTSDEMHGFIKFLLQWETLNIQKQTNCIILCFLSFEPVYK